MFDAIMAALSRRKVWWRRILVVGCWLMATASGAWAAPSMKLTAVADRWCPFTCDPTSDQPGYAVEILRRILEPKGYQIEYKNLGWLRALKETVDGNIDIAIGTWNGEEPSLVLPERPCAISISKFFVRKDDPWRYRSPSDVNSRMIGTIDGYNYSEAFDAWVVAHPDRVSSKSGDDGLEKNIRQLAAGRVDTVIEDPNVFEYTANQLGMSGQFVAANEIPIEDHASSNALYFGISPKREDAKQLAGLLSEGLQEMRVSGKLAEILARYHVSDWE
jgi:polar amino acid transport system substrate-binding protein